MRDQRLTQMEGLGLIVNQEGGRNTIVPRDRKWLEERGILTYDALPLSKIAIAENTGQSFFHVQMLHPAASGVEISRKKYEELLNMPYQDGMEGLDSLFEVAEASQTVEPTGSPLTPAMCEVYTRLGKLFLDKGDSWKKAETVLYFGRTIR